MGLAAVTANLKIDTNARSRGAPDAGRIIRKHEIMIGIDQRPRPGVYFSFYLARPPARVPKENPHLCRTLPTHHCNQRVNGRRNREQVAHAVGAIHLKLRGMKHQRRGRLNRPADVNRNQRVTLWRLFTEERQDFLGRAKFDKAIDDQAERATVAVSDDQNNGLREIRILEGRLGDKQPTDRGLGGSDPPAADTDEESEKSAKKEGPHATPSSESA